MTARVPAQVKDLLPQWIEAWAQERQSGRPPRAEAWKALRLLPNQPSQVELPVGLSRVSAGFPSPAEDYEDQRLDINEFLVQRPAATFLFQVDGVSMTDFGIMDSDYLVCDRSVRPQDGDVVIAFVGGERLVKQLSIKGPRYRLLSGHPDFPPVDIEPACDFEIWGVVVGKFARFTRTGRKR